MLGTLLMGTAYATFSSSDRNPGNAFSATYWAYAAAVEEDAPSFWWRLGEGGAGLDVFTEDFEGAFGWTAYNSGTFSASTARSRTGTGSGLKDSNNDPNGGWAPLGFTTGTDWTFETWIYRSSASRGGASDRVALEDGSFDGYGVQIDHNGNRFRIERRDGGSGVALATATFDPPEDQWYRVVLTRSGSGFSAAVYDSGATELASASTTDSTHGAANRFVVHGGYDYYVDDVTVTATTAPTSTVAIDAVGNLDGTYMASPGLGQPSLIDGETDTAVLFDGTAWVTIGDSSLLNTTTRSQRTVELWFRADVTTGRQVLYEEGGSTNGMVVYLDGTSLRARAWSNSTGWSNQLDTAAPVAAGQIYHVAVTLDTDADPNLILYVNGAQADTASKLDGNAWNAHTDDGGIAAQNGSTRYHDGASSGTGTNGFRGAIDDVAVYNTVLPASRIMIHWTAGTP